MDFEIIEKLVVSAKTENKLAKELLVEEFKPFILNLSNKTFINGYDKHDIQNECYKSLFKCVSLYNPEKHRFVAYATNGIKNNISDLIKKSKNRSSSEGAEALTLSDNLEHTIQSDAASLEDMLCIKAEYKALKYALEDLNEDEKELIIFVFFKNNPLKNYAYWKNMCYSTATQKKRKILKKLKEVIS
jgi:RNA polymerase sigma factor (sigma-70 family)